MKLIWVYDSPFSRSIKWLLLSNNIEHEDYVLTWEEMASDPLLALNPKKQVPTIWTNEQVKTDSLLIALDYLPSTWYQSNDAKLFRLADSDVETAIIFLFRANLLEEKFGVSPNSKLMREAGIDIYKRTIDCLVDHILAKSSEPECNFGAVLLWSTMLAADSLASNKLLNYRLNEVTKFIDVVVTNKAYNKMINSYQGKKSNHLAFTYDTKQ